MSAVAKPASVTGEETLGAKATRLAQEKAKIWLDSTFQVRSSMPNIFSYMCSALSHDIEILPEAFFELDCFDRFLLQ